MFFAPGLLVVSDLDLVPWRNLRALAAMMAYGLLRLASYSPILAAIADQTMRQDG